MEPVLVGTSHGTDDPAGRHAVRALLDGVRAARPGLDVREAFVDVQQPEVADVLARAVDEAGSAVVVPLLLSTGYHVRVDIAAAVDGVNAAHAVAGPDARPVAGAAQPLGPDPRLVDILVERLAAAEPRPEDALVLAAAGSSVAAAAVAVEQVARGLAERVGRPVVAAYGAGAKPRVPDAVRAARDRIASAAGPAEGAGPGRVVVVSYLLGPGYFLDRMLEMGADVVTETVSGAPYADTPDPRLVQVVLDRYDAAVAALRA